MPRVRQLTFVGLQLRGAPQQGGCTPQQAPSFIAPGKFRQAAVLSGDLRGTLWHTDVTYDEEVDLMALRKLGKDPESPSGGSPTVYLDEEKDTYLVQGWKVLDDERLGKMDIPGHESVVEIPRRMVQFFLEVRRDHGSDV